MAGNIFQTGMDAYKDSYLTQRAMGEDRARMRAGRALASGNRSQAAQEFGAAGLTDDVRLMKAGDEALEQKQYERGRQEKEDNAAGAERLFKTLAILGRGIQERIPEGPNKEGLPQRKAMLDHVMPMLQQIDPDPDGPHSLVRAIGALTPEQLDDATLSPFVGEMEKQWQAINLGAGGVAAYNNKTNEFKTLREPDPKLQIVGNGAVALDPETHQPIFRNPKTFAPPRPTKGAGNDAALAAIEAELRRRGKI